MPPVIPIKDMKKKEIVDTVKELVRKGAIDIREPGDTTHRRPVKEYSSELAVNVQKVGVTNNIAVTVFGYNLNICENGSVLFFLIYPSGDPQAKPTMGN